MTSHRDRAGSSPSLRRGAAALACAAAVLAAPGAPPAAAYRAQAANVSQPAGERAHVPAATRTARRALRRRLGRFAVLTADPATGAIRQLARLDGTLTGATTDSDAAAVRLFLDANITALGLSKADLAALRLDGRDPLPGGGARLRFSQSRSGIPAVDFGVRVTVDARGRLLSLDGTPRPLGALTTEPGLTAAQAYAIAREASGDPAAAPAATQAAGATRPTTFATGERAALVLYGREQTVRLGWRVLTQPSGSAFYDTIVDAATGAVHSRANLVSGIGAEALAYDGIPGVNGASQGDRPITVDSFGALRNDRVHAFLDIDDQIPKSTNVFAPTIDSDFDVPEAGDVTPGDGLWEYRLRTGLVPQPASSNCDPFTCSWVPGAKNSWRTVEGLPADRQHNDEQSAVQLFVSVNGFLDHLAAAPIGFGTVAGDGAFGDGDRILAQAMDGANTSFGGPVPGPGLPDVNHQSNASMLVLPDGSPSYLQSYLFDPSQTPTSRAVSSANDPSIVFHEVAHAMIHRLVTDAQGYGAVSAPQAGAIDEGLADFYALDHLVATGRLPDDPGVADVRIGTYSDTLGLRSQPIDAMGDGRLGLGDFGSIDPAGGPEIHFDGEIVAQMLWELRNHPGLGRDEVLALVTTALRMVPPQPSVLDLRNAMLVAHTGDDTPLWEVFAGRGMGYFASTEGADDVVPSPNGDLPPATPAADRVATLSGTVTELGGAPQAGVTVSVAGHESIGEGLEDETDASGDYAIPVPVADSQATRTLPYVVARGPGGLMTQRRRDVVVAAGGTVDLDIAMPRNHAARAAGAVAALGAGEDPSLDYTKQGCGPSGLTDVGRTVWGSSANRTGASSTPAPRSAVVALATPIALGAIRIDPTAGCGDPVGASLGSYEVLTSPDGQTWTKVADGSFTRTDVGASREIGLLTRPLGVRFVRLVARNTIARSATGPTAFDRDNGFMDTGELEVYDQAAFPDFVPPRDPPPPVTITNGPTTPPVTPPPPATTLPPRPPAIGPSTGAKARAPVPVTCATRRARGRIRVTCRLRNATGARTATVRLSRAGRTVARAGGRVRAGRLPTLTLRARARRSYRLTVVVRSGGRARPRTVARSITL